MADGFGLLYALDNIGEIRVQIGKKTRAVSAALILLAPALAHALAVGPIEGKSYLNQPLEARIPLAAVTPAELKSLRVSLAPSEVYQRAGIDLGPEQAGLQFQVVTGAGTPYVRVTSRDSIQDPFLTFLVEITWAEGRLVREYTLLLDPPTLMAPANPPETRQPVVQPTAPPEIPEAPAPEVTALPEPAPVRAQPAAERRQDDRDSDEGLRVRRGDTLWRIARDNNTDDAVNINQMMLAIYTRNPEAFNGNINQLKAGAILRMPSADEARAISRAAALAEVRRQEEAWRAGRPTQVAKTRPAPIETGSQSAPAAGTTKAMPVPTRPRLELVAPEETESVAPPSAATDLGGSTMDGQGTDAMGQTSSGQPGPAGESAGLMQMDSATALALQTPPDVAPEANSTAGLSEPNTLQALPPQPADSPMTSPTPSDLSDVDEANGGVSGLGALWWALLAAAAGLIAWLLWRRRHSADGYEEEPDFVLNNEGEDQLKASIPQRMGDAKRQEPVWSENDSFLEDRQEARPELDTQPGLSSFTPQAPLGVDQEDPLAEADFNLAYGLFDEALAVVEQALSRQPERRDLKLKRLEVLFAASDKAGFLKHAQELAAEPQGQADSAWERCMMMGQQMLPDEPLFQNAPLPSMSGEDFLDLDLSPSAVSSPGKESDPQHNDAFDGESATEVVGRRQESILASESGVDFNDGVDRGDLSFEFAAGTMEPEAVTQSENTIEKHLDMARVYLGMEEFTAARRELEQALLEGTAEQKAEAHELMSQVENRGGMVEDETAQALMVDVPGTGTLDIEDFGTRDDNGTRLDLARQYMELDDVEGARTLIEEVIKEGSPDQRREAETLRAQLPSRF